MEKYPQTLNKKCKNCDGEIVAKRKRDINKVFCSTACVGKFLHTKPLKYINCKQCGSSFKFSSNNKNIFCSKICANKNKIKVHIRVCEFCGKKFQLKNIAYEKRGGGKYCSIVCKNRKYFFDEKYFNNINTANKAYWLGFIFGDGNVYKQTLTIHLSKNDINHLVAFKNDIKSNKDIMFRNDGSVEYRIYSEKIITDLLKLGVVPNKTFKLEYPNIPQKYNKDFIRGYFDADGCMYVSKNDRYKCWSIFGVSKNIIIKIKEIIQEECGITLNDRTQGNGFVISTSKYNNIKIIKKYLYSNKKRYLQRKLDKFNLLF